MFLGKFLYVPTFFNDKNIDFRSVSLHLCLKHILFSREFFSISRDYVKFFEENICEIPEKLLHLFLKLLYTYTFS